MYTAVTAKLRLLAESVLAENYLLTLPNLPGIAITLPARGTESYYADFPLRLLASELSSFSAKFMPLVATLPFLLNLVASKI